MEHRLVEGVERFVGVVLLGDRQPRAMLEDLADFELLEVEAGALPEASLADLDMGREGEQSI